MEPNKTKIPKEWTKALALRVKHTQTNSKYGIRCRNPFGNQADIYVFSGEDADVKKKEIRGKDWAQLLLVAEFTRGRELTLAESDLFSTVAPRHMPWHMDDYVQLYVSLGIDLDDFIPVADSRIEVRYRE